ncbi:clavesin-1-like [Centruroides sculpturatus]|uniref:clavesin-1-like n=1 Tax=Centruroides sculpturatus TaxID=218467 RepID=UPI000C6D58F4|nr:clavesin-1-like [Centruroides sculpturatus]XP_023212466.1 clavesin-1-like [Centruroides sculpturatus]
MNTSDEVNQKPDYGWNEEILEEFRKDVLKEKHLKCRTDDIFLLSFLRARKFDRERALTLLKMYYSTRKKYPIVFKNLKPSALELVMDQNMMTCVKTENMVISMGRYSHWDPSKVGVIDVLRAVLLMFDFQLNDHPIQVHGQYILIDTKELSWRHIFQFTPRNTFIVMSSMFNCIPLRYNALHYVNVNTYVKFLYSIVRPFFPDKLKKRMHFHGSDMKELHKVIDPKYLPADFGGELPPFDASEYNQTLRENEEFFVENEKYWTEEENT